MPQQQRRPSPPEPSRVDPAIWRASAGSLVHIPPIHSRVYYFPQGHLERSFPSPAALSSLNVSRPVFQCVVNQVQFLSDPVTDQVFAKLLLTPINATAEPSRELVEHQQQQFHHQQLEDRNVDNYIRENIVAPFAKVLTPSDANNGGGFSVPRFCADSIFPPLNYQADPPVQTLSITDIHGHVWDFRHIYRGTPRRHLLTTGWSKFVNRKKLIAGDSVVFMRDSTGRLFVGIRRAERYGDDGDGARWGEHSGVKVEEVMEALERASLGLPFEVVYYPRSGWPDFIVRAEIVEAAMKILWSAGVRVKMMTETEDLSRLTSFQGTIEDASMPNRGTWCGSPWRMLEVTWDEPEILQNVKRVNPWQLEFVSTSVPLHTPFPSAKRLKFPQNSGLVTDGEEEVTFPLRGLTDSTTGHMYPSLLNYNTFPAGMQGARQNTNSFFSLSNFISENTHQMCSDNTSGINIVPKLKNVGTELNMGSSQSENLSPDSHSSAYSFGTELLGNQGCNTAKNGASSFQLFGKIIHTNQPVESGSDDVACTEDDGGKGFNETEVKLLYRYLSRQEINFLELGSSSWCKLVMFSSQCYKAGT
ncbi:hypothetical protein LWI29_005056 [Acer saccharum]|uniref:Auxin response factor n=1 Tax=Acer saccharum TaxID=4024 RepID=A0AA39RL41_ACESA|nr:hypothetical protein LWI29_005056 [Acer saccharum]